MSAVLTRGGPKRLIGMVHLGPLEGGAAALAHTLSRAEADARALAAAGFTAICVENFGDAPFYPDRVPAHTVARMTRAAWAVRSAAPGVDLGVNVLRNDVLSALAVAGAVSASFVRVNVHVGAAVTDQGVVSGRAHQSVRYRDREAPGVAIFADVQVKHAAPLAPRPLAEEAAETAGRGRADALIVSGAHTGAATDPAVARAVRAAAPATPVLVGSGATPQTLEALWPHVDGFIVGSWLKEGGVTTAPVDPARAATFIAHARALGA